MDAVDVIEQALQVAVAERNILERQIQILRRSVAELRAAEHDEAPRPTLRADASHPRSVRAVVMDLVATRDVFTLGDVMAKLSDEGNGAAEASVSSILSRVRKEGLLQRGPHRGTYRGIPATDASTDAEASDLSEASEQATLATAGTVAPDLEGGDRNDADPDRDHHSAPVAGAR